MKGLVDGPVKWAGFPEDSPDPETPSEAALATRGGFMVQATSTIEASARPLRTATGRRLVHAVWMPPVLAADLEEEPLPAVVTPQVIIKTKIRLEPPFEGEEGIRLWTTPTDHTAKGDRKMHLHYADSALSLLRASRQCTAEAWLIRGDAVIPFLICVSEWLRVMAFDARRVGVEQRRELGEAFYRVRCALIHSPCGHPPFSGLSTIEKLLGAEIKNVVIPAHLQVSALRLRGDPYESDTERVLRWIQGHVSVQTLDASPTPAFWGRWRADWVPSLELRDLEPAPLLYATSGNVMHHLVSTFTVPALHLEMGTLKDEQGRKRIARSLAKGEHSVLHIREDD